MGKIISSFSPKVFLYMKISIYIYIIAKASKVFVSIGWQQDLIRFISVGWSQDILIKHIYFGCQHIL